MEQHSPYSKPLDPKSQGVSVPTSQTTTSSSYPPFTAKQPPLQMPFGDGFNSRPRDPFMPTPNGSLQTHYSLNGREQQEQRDGRDQSTSNWIPTGPPSGMQPHLSPPAFQSPSRNYQSIPAPESPSSSYLNRHMPPPSPSQIPSIHSYNGSSRSTFAAARDLPAIITSSNRPGGMSISSILGVENNTSPHQEWRGSGSPEKHDGRVSYSSASSPKYNAQQGSPDTLRNGLPQNYSPPSNQQSQFPPRSNSQPSGTKSHYSHHPTGRPNGTTDGFPPLTVGKNLSPTNPNYNQPSSAGSDDFRRNLIRDETKSNNTSPLRSGFRGMYYEAPRSNPSEVVKRGNDFYPPRDLPQPSKSAFELDRRRDNNMVREDFRDPRRNAGEDMQRSKSLLGIASEMNKKGRSSPLPQAMKGAQVQMNGPGSDPSIKSEFGRIFQGLGSSLGGLGSLTPSRQSPVPQRVRDDMPANEGEKMIASLSQNGRLLNRRPTDDDVNQQVASGRNTPFDQIIGRNKRQRTTQNAGKETSSVRSTYQQPQAQVPMDFLPIPKPTVSFDIQPLLHLASMNQRHHYGSTVYTPENTISPFADSGPNDYYMKFSARQFTEDQINGTFTIRIPSWFLTESKRQKACQDRYLFGTEVHTDDSDVLVAAIHSGWIRGAWPKDFDTNLMDLAPLDIQDELLTDDERKKLFRNKQITERPAVPLVPPKGMEAQITVLVLPRLEEYKGSHRFGISSRNWGGTHDGLSYRIHKIVLGEEGQNAGYQRTAAGRKARRLQKLRDSGRLNELDVLTTSV